MSNVKPLFWKGLFCWLILFANGYRPLKAQSTWKSIYATNTNVSLIPPSPNAASFQKYGITPVSFSSGLPNLSIPIYEVKAGDIVMPITLSYHLNGLKPKEEASWTGLGWNLNIGGCITRIKRGAVDGTRPAGRNFGDIHPFDSAINTTNSDPVHNTYPYQTFLANTYFLQYYDTEPDVFVFNFMGYQGKFLFVNGQAHFMEYENWVVTKLSDDQGFFITDENGTQYQFTNVEHTRVKDAGKADPYDSPLGWASCWQLTRVVTADRHHWMNFSYAAYTYADLNTLASQLYKVGYGEKAISNVSESVCKYPSSGTSQLTTNTPTGNFVYSQGLTSVQTSEQQTITLVQSANTRKDVSSGQNALQQVVVYGQSGNPDTVIKKMAFHYGYFGDSSSYYSARLKLSGMYELSGNGDTLNNYSFEYQNEFDNFPSKSTVSIDKWGYYNGPDMSANDASLLPNVYFGSYSVGMKTTSIYPPCQGIAPNFSYGKFGVLSKIHYPTGGYTVLTFEQNKYRTYGGTPLSNSYTADTTINKQLFYTSNTRKLDSTYGGFTINNTTLAYITTVRQLWDSLSLPLKEFKPLLYIRRVSNYQACSNDTNIPIIPCTYDTVYTCPLFFTDNTRTDTLTLSPGVYSYTLYCESNSMNTQTALVYQVIKTTVYDNENAPAGPGIRIAASADYTDTSASQQVLQRSYIYTDSSGLCSGVLQEAPKYTIYTTEEGTCPSLMYNLSSDNNGIYNANLDFQFYYSAVREYVAPAQSNTYYTEHYFSPVEIVSPYRMQDFYAGEGEVDAGSLPGNMAIIENLVLADPVEIKTVDWKNTGAGYSKLKDVRTSYAMAQDTFFTGVKPVSLTDANAQGFNPFTTAWTFNAYTIYCLWRHLATRQETDYDSTGNQYNVSTNYTYDQRTRHLARTEETINNGKTIVTKYKYPDNYEEVPSIARLSNNHVLSPAVETQVWQKTATDSSIIRGVVDDYDSATFKPSKKYFLFTAQPLVSLNNEQMDDPPLFSTLLSDTRYREKIRLSYDLRGNIIETTLDSNLNVPTAYVWGYHSLYPVAKVVGARFSSVLQKIDTAAIQSITDDALLRAALNPLRSISGAQVTTYTYTPFVGVTSETDLNGKTTYYEYDEFNRVSNIRDYQHNLIKNFIYHYVGQTKP